MPSSSVDLFVGLPVELTRQLVTIWLTLTDVGRVDSAYCHAEKRLLLLAVLASWSINSNSADSSDGETREASVSWLKERKIRVKSLTVSGADPMYWDYTREFGDTITHFTVKDLSETSLETCCITVAHCANIDVLIFEGGIFYPSTLNSVLQQTRPLSELHIWDCNLLDIEPSTEQLRSRFLSVTILVLNFVDPFIAESVLSICLAAPLKSIVVVANPSDPIIVDELQVLFDYKDFALTKFSYSGEIYDDSLIDLLGKCPTIEDLDLSNSRYLTDASAAAIARAQLRTLSVVEANYSDELLHELAAHSRETLESLSIESCFEMTGEGMSTLLPNCRKLHTLHVFLSDYFEFDASLLKPIRTLGVECDVEMDPKPFLTRLASSCRELQHLYLTLYGCTVQTLASITKKNYPALLTLKLVVSLFERYDYSTESIRDMMEIVLLAQLPGVTVSVVLM